MKIKRLLALVCSLSLTMVLAVMSFTSAYAESETKTLEQLYDAAKAEGKVIWQIPTTCETYRPVMTAFEARYPGVKVECVAQRSTDLPVRLITEIKAAKPSIDVGTTSPVYLVPLYDRDLVIQYDWVKLGIDPIKIMLDGRSLALYDVPSGWVRNTKLVSESEAPRSFEDLLDPKWKGLKLCIQPLGTHFTQLFTLWQKNPAKAEELLIRLKNQKLLLAKRSTEVADKVARGEAQLGAIALTILPKLIEEGAPLALCSIGPAINASYGVYTVKKARHPNAALLFVHFAGSEDEVIALTGRGAATPPDASKLAAMLHNAGIEFIRIDKIEDIRDFLEYAEFALKCLGF
jgi:iron(III) transport system substrate-binding protein